MMEELGVVAQYHMQCFLGLDHCGHLRLAVDVFAA